MSYGNCLSALLISFTIFFRCIIVQFSANILKKGKGRIIFLILCYIKLYRYNALRRYRLFYTNIFIPSRFSVAESPQSAVHSIIYKIPESSLTIVLSRVINFSLGSAFDLQSWVIQQFSGIKVNFAKFVSIYFDQAIFRQ